jgi:hypothetical protein
MNRTRRRGVAALAGLALATAIVAAPATGSQGRAGDIGGIRDAGLTAQGGQGGGGGGGGGNLPDPNPRARVACESRGNGVPRFCVATTENVQSNGLSSDQGGQLAAALGLGDQFAAGEAFVDNGVFKYIDPELYQRVPSISVDAPLGTPGDDPAESVANHTVLDVVTIAQQLAAGPNVLSDSAALDRVQQALGSGFIPAGAVPTVSNNSVKLAWNPTSSLPANPLIGEKAELLLDTVVSYTTVLDGVPVVGPGSKVNVTLNPDGVVTQVQYAARQLADGARVEIVDPAQAPAMCRTALGLPANAPVSADLVYYAPALQDGANPGALLPHFECAPDESTEGPLPLIQFIPAVKNAPSASIPSVTVNGADVTATGAASGGTPPYAFSWTSTGTAGDPPPATNPTSYTVVGRDTADVPETLVLTVTDANGLTATASRSFDVHTGSTAAAAASVSGDGVSDVLDDVAGPHQMSHAVNGAFETGADSATSTPDCGPIVDGWTNTVNGHGASSQFTYYTGSSWSTDFQKPGVGDDHNYVDDVDAMFYCGHGFQGGFTFENQYGPSDKNVTPSEMQLGDRDLEWLILESCQVLREDWTGSSWTAIWGQSFNGMHAMYGFHTNANAQQTGAAVAKYMLGVGVPAKTMHYSYIQGAVDTQPTGNEWAALYPVGYNYEFNANDWFWGKGNVSADIPASNIYYWARYQGAT